MEVHVIPAFAKLLKFAAHMPVGADTGLLHDFAKRLIQEQRFFRSTPTNNEVHFVASRVSPAVDVRHSCRGRDIVETLERGAAEFGYPRTIRVDNGPEFVSKEFDLWAYMKGVTLDLSTARTSIGLMVLILSPPKLAYARLNSQSFFLIVAVAAPSRRNLPIYSFASL